MYVDPTRIIDKLPSAYPEMIREKNPSATDEQLQVIWEARIDAEIAHYSRYVDDGVGQDYSRAGTYKFPAWDDDPATPAVVSEACYYLAYAQCLDYYKPARGSDDDKEVHSFRAMGEQILRDIRERKIVIEIADFGMESSGTVSLAMKTRHNKFTRHKFQGFGK